MRFNLIWSQSAFVERLKKTQARCLRHKDPFQRYRSVKSSLNVRGDGRRTFKHVRHLADLCKGGAVGPGVHHVHQVGLELAQVGFLVHLQLGVGGNLGDPLGALLTHDGKERSLDYKRLKR